MRRVVVMIAVLGAGEAHAGEGELAARAAEVLEAHCVRCHGGGPGADRGGFDRARDLDGVVAGGWVVAGDTGGSELLERMAAGEMPPADVRARPTAADIAAVRAWIEAGAPTPAAGAGPDRARLAAWMAADLGGLPADQRRYARYLSVDHVPAGGRAVARAAVIKLVNSLSWRRRLHRPAVIGGGALVRIDLRQLGWSRSTWERLARRAPAATVDHGGGWRAVHLAAGTYAPVVSADWLVAVASTPPVYHELLAMPADLEGLRRRLGVDGSAVRVRAGFNGSGVSQHNRLIEREPLADGGYLWRSYDFDSSQGDSNLFEHPLGPAGAGLRPAGGEVIFSLPNGLQGYMLIDARGRRIDRAPTSIVVDRARADSAVINGLSCMGCHDRGVIAKRDQLRGHVAGNRTAFDLRDPALAPRVLALHPPQAVLDRLYAADRARFAAALATLGVGATAEPIDAVARDYQRAVDRRRAARELAVSDDALASAIVGAGVRPRLGPLLAAGGTVDRAVWDREVGALADALGRTRLAELPVDAELDLRCEAGTGADCYELADRFYRGRGGVSRDLARALRLYRAACARDYGAGCTAVGLLVGRGLGAAPDPWAAAVGFGRGCRLGHARGCERLGRALLAGDGIAVDRARARWALDRACDGGRTRACTTAGDLRYHGIGVAADHAAALALYRRACAAGEVRACRNASYLYRRGHGVAADSVVAAAYLGRACRLGHGGSCEAAGDVAAAGRGVRRDPRLAADYYQHGCGLGRGESCRKLALQYRWGKGVAPDWIRSERLFRRACELGSQPACLYL